MKALKVTAKILAVLLAVLVVCFAALAVVYRDQIATVYSVEKIDDYPIYKIK